MNKLASIFFFLLFIFSCTDNRQRPDAAQSTPRQDTLAPLQITILANLPDSLQPKTRPLDALPKPQFVPVPAKSQIYSVINDKGQVVRKINLEPPVNKTLPVLQNAKGDVIKDSAGNPFMMGNGGISIFTNFTTDNGLALDGVNCSIVDRKGNLWFGTDGGGVSRYDGRSFTTFAAAQGLGNNTVLSMAEDRKGNLWFGTQGGGVSRYDGKVFTTYTVAEGLANNNVWTIVEDRTGKMWFGTDGGGVCYYDPVARPGKQFTVFTTQNGLPDNAVISMAEDGTGKLWFGTNGGGVCRYDPSASGPKAFTIFGTDAGLISSRVWSIFEDKKGTLWFGTQGGGVSHYDPATPPRAGEKLFTTYTTAQGLAHNIVRSIVEDKSGNLWFGTQGGGVTRYDPSASPKNGSKSFTTFSIGQGLGNNTVCSITEDKTGNLWFGTGGGGVSRYDGKLFTAFSTAHGLADNFVSCMAEDKKGNLWLGTYGYGVSRFDGKSFTNYTTAQGLTSNYIMTIAEDKDGYIWFGSAGGGASRYDGKSFNTYTMNEGLSRNIIWYMTQDSKGNFWLATAGGGVSRYDGKSFTNYSKIQGLANNWVRCVAEDKKGNLWFGTDGWGVTRFDGKSLITYTTAHGRPNNVISSIALDHAGNLWFATAEGLNVMSAEESTDPQAGGKPKIFRTFTKSDGLPDDFVSQVMQLPNGKMAIGTNLGIMLFKPSEDLGKLNDIELYNANTDCPVKNINTGQNTMLLDSKGSIWAGTGSQKTALVRFDPSALQTDNSLPSLVIKSVKVNEEHICWHDLDRESKGMPIADSTNSAHPGAPILVGEGHGGTTPAYVVEEATILGKVLTERERDSVRHRFSGIRFDSITRFYPVPQHLVLPYNCNRVTIDFNALETGKPDLVNYQYMLEGYDKNWSPILKTSSATFGNISEGAYVFKVRAQGPNGRWCEPVTYEFRILPPWYRSWWAYTGYALLLLLSLRIFISWRLRNVRTENDKLERTVEKRTEELVQKNIAVEEQKTFVEKEKQRSEALLLNILPEEVAEELKAKGATTAKHFDNVTVLFTDFVNFTNAGERMSPQGLVDELHTCFKAFDEITGKYNIEKIKTVGDAYLAVAGLPTPDAKHAENAVKAALEISAFMQVRFKERGDSTFEVRIGINSGNVVAGVVGVKKFAYDIWGDTVNTAARMEQNSDAGKVNISESTYELVKGKFAFEDRGEVDVKGKGKLRMYYVSML